MNELINRAELLSTALYCGGLYAAWRVALTVAFPFCSSFMWQSVIGPIVTRKCQTLGQSDDISRPSYFGTAVGQPYVIASGIFAVSIDDLTSGIRDGLLLGVLSALLPEVMQPAFLTVILAFVIVKNAWRISRAAGAVKTDRAICAVREGLMYSGAILALEYAQVLR